MNEQQFSDNGTGVPTNVFAAAPSPFLRPRTQPGRGPVLGRFFARPPSFSRFLNASPYGSGPPVPARPRLCRYRTGELVGRP